MGRVQGRYPSSCGFFCRTVSPNILMTYLLHLVGLISDGLLPLSSRIFRACTVVIAGTGTGLGGKGKVLIFTNMANVQACLRCDLGMTRHDVCMLHVRTVFVCWKSVCRGEMSLGGWAGAGVHAGVEAGAASRLGALAPPNTQRSPEPELLALL